MRCTITVAVLSAGLLLPIPARAGLHYSGERYAELPSQWRGLVQDLRALRSISVKPTAALPASPLRKEYEEAAASLKAATSRRELTADEKADLGAILIRLGEVEEALAVLREAHRQHPQHYAIAANLGTAWQLYGDLERAADCLRLAVQLAPGRWQKAEEYHLKLVQHRLRRGRDDQGLDDLFGVRFVGESGSFEPGKLAAAERKKLTADAVAVAQQLALWLPGDARLHWQLAELANAHGDVKAAYEFYEICVGQFGLIDPALRERRIAVKEAVDRLAKLPPGSETAKAEHAGHAGTIATKSRRPLAAKRFDLSSLPAIDKEGVNHLPWGLLLETSVDRNFKPTFPKYLEELNSHTVSLTGFIQPLTDDLELNVFMLIEYPTGCWYCEMPEINGIVLVELPADKSIRYSRNQVKVTGKLSLNATDPENFLYTIKEAKVIEAD
jgi:tetratricopeptide (TPR) repeat protein